jgi:hypothetical protein
MKLSIPIPLFLTTIIGRTCSYFANSTLSEKKLITSIIWLFSPHLS